MAEFQLSLPQNHSMKTLVTILLLSAGTAFGQMSDRQSKRELKETVQDQLNVIDSMQVMLEEANLQGAESVELMLKFQRENETLRTIMRDYVKQIDELNVEVMRLKTDLVKCKD